MRSWTRILDAAYRIDVDEPTWFDATARAVATRIDRGLGVCGMLFDASDPGGLRTQPIQFFDCSDTVREFAAGALQTLTPGIISDSIVSPPVCMSSEVLGWDRVRAWFKSVGVGGIADTLALVAIDPTGQGCLLIAPTRHTRGIPARDRAVLERVSAHVATGQRLRRVLLRAGTAPLDSAEAILDPDGKVVHAVGEAQPEDARAALRRGALRIDRARARGDAAPDENLAMWSALIEGRWSILDRFDTDGRRFFVAYQNDPSVTAHRSLTRRELQVASYAALGHANKLIAYELGLSLSTVATHLASAQAKLGVRSRSDLIAVVRKLASTLSTRGEA